MRINRVELKNYRTHAELEVEFSEGINLLLGSNGSGKTSVLEAIGIAMFDTGNRSTIKESIKNGEKSASINIDFTGNDGLDYIIERKIGTVTRHRIFEKDNPENELSGKSEVVGKVTELCGIKKNSSKIYESVVTVRQNEIVNLFMGTNSEREAVFNEIFDTEIYRDIYKNYSKNVLDRYKQDVEITNAKIGEITGMLIDVEELQSRLSLNSEKKEKMEISKNEFNLEYKTLEEKKDKLEVTQRAIKEADSAKDTETTLLNSLNNQLVKNKINLEKAEEAKEIVIDKRDAFLEFRNSSKELRDVQEKLRELESYKKQKEHLTTEAVKLEKSVLSMRNEIDKNNEQIKLTNNIISDLEVQHSKKSTKYEEVRKKEELIKTDLNKVIATQSELEKELITLNEIEKDYIIKNSEIIKLKEFIDNFDLDNYKYSCEELDNNLKEHEKQKQEKAELEKKRQEQIILLNQNKEASEILGEGMCPYLNENCKNIAADDDVSAYFNIKEKSLNEMLATIENDLEGFTSIDTTEKKLRQEKNKLELEIKTLDKKKEDLKYFEKELENLKLLESNKKFEIKEKIKSDDLEEFLDYFNDFKFNELNEKLKEKKINLEATLFNLNIEEQKQELHKLHLDIKLKNAEILNIKENIKKAEISILGFEQEVKSISKKIDDINEKLSEQSQLIDKEKTLISSVDELKADYEKYMEYINTAKTYHDVKAENEELNTKIADRKQKIEELLIKLGELSENYNEDEYNKAKEKIIELKTKLEIAQKELFDIEYQIKDDEKELSRFKQNQKKIKKLKQENTKLNKKINLTEKFREYINKIGKNISKQMIEKISLISTENFREITGRSEMLEWRTTDKEAYMLYLVDDKTARKFNLLSGGEQVAAALAVRAAMASALSKANFAIFDEPTNNLDEERRKALADSLSKVLEGIKQSIIVTHDDTFQEMANKIIRL